MKSIALPVLLSLLWLAGCAVPIRTYRPLYHPPEEGEAPSGIQIRVAVVVRQDSVTLVAPQTFALSGFAPGDTPDSGDPEKRFREAVLTPEQLYTNKAYLAPLGDGEIQVNGRNFRGSMEIVRDAGDTLTVINQLPLADYVMGVVAGEIPGTWPLEALKAQAIASRTFAVLKRREARAKGQAYDLENTAFSQVYQGSGKVNDNIRKAVLDTRDEILTYDGKPIMAFFHSNCGGATTGSKDVWGQDLPYLQSVSCPYGDKGAHFRWTAQVPIPELVRKLRGAGILLSDIVRIRPVSRDESRRILELSLMDGDGTVKTLKGTAFRMAVGPDLIRSTRFDAQIRGDKVFFEGKGWGHGVGLCQEGACGMALKGYGAFDILRHYYKGVMVEKIRD
jgi:stage II sporulation protein D (peptidoglycan lytic transglycosylase)